jgi:hypothetical protein
MPGARSLAASGSLASAQEALGTTVYGRRVRPGQDLAATEHEIAAGLLWDLRVLAGWLPAPGVRLLRVLAAWFEMANVDELLFRFAGLGAGPEPEPDALFELGALATAWPRLRQGGLAGGLAGLRGALAASPWRDPGGGTPGAVRLGMRARYAAWAAELGEPVRSWTAEAKEMLVSAGPAGAAPWRAEAAWRARVEDEGLRLLRTSGLDRGAVLGAVTVLACDAWRVQAALEIAARGGVGGGGGAGLGVYDELA